MTRPHSVLSFHKLLSLKTWFFVFMSCKLYTSNRSQYLVIPEKVAFVNIAQSTFKWPCYKQQFIYTLNTNYEHIQRDWCSSRNLMIKTSESFTSNRQIFEFSHYNKTFYSAPGAFIKSDTMREVGVLCVGNYFRWKEKLYHSLLLLLLLLCHVLYKL